MQASWERPSASWMHCLTTEASVIDQKNPKDVGSKRLKACETFQNACYCYEPLFQKLMRREHQDDSRQALSQIVTAPVSWAQVVPTYRRDKESSRKLKANQQTIVCFCIRNYGPSSSCFFLDSCTYIVVNLCWNIEHRIPMQIGYLQTTHVRIMWQPKIFETSQWSPKNCYI